MSPFFPSLFISNIFIRGNYRSFINTFSTVQDFFLYDPWKSLILLLIILTILQMVAHAHLLTRTIERVSFFPYLFISNIGYLIFMPFFTKILEGLTKNQHRWFDEKSFCEPPLGMQEDALVLCIVG